MKPAQFLSLLSAVRSSDDSLGATLADIGMYVLEQFHKHGNKTPHGQLFLAIDGGTDAHGFFGVKGAEIRGVSKGLAQLFSGLRKLGKQDPTADVEVLAQLCVDSGMKSRSEATAEAKHAREARAKAKAKEAAKQADDLITCALVLPSGAAIKLSPKEAAALEQTLKALRSQEEASEIIDMECSVITEAALLLAA